MTMFAWLERYGRRIVFQQLPQSRVRGKNRVILEFTNDRGELSVCGAPSLLGVVIKAQGRNRLARSLNGRPNPAKEGE